MKHSEMRAKEMRQKHLFYLFCSITSSILAFIFLCCVSTFAIYFALSDEPQEIITPLVFGAICLIISIIIDVFEIRAYVKCKEKYSEAEPDAPATDLAETPALRKAELNADHKILLQTQIESYHIVYRRVIITNELVVNDLVYDEKKGLFEFEHTLRAVVDGHLIEAGLDDVSFSFITYDEELVEYKKRYF